MTTDRVMLLIDADNVSVDVMEQAVSRLLEEYGALHVRRAYCTAESAVKHQAVFKRLSIKPMVNLAAGKNSTDIALAVDAIDLVLAERPDVVVIASSDSDFAPLVGRLREKGCKVRGIGQEGKTGDETRSVYDSFDVLAHRGRATASTRTAARKTTRRRSAEVEVAPVQGETVEAPEVAPVAKTRTRRSSTKKAESAAQPAVETAVATKSTRTPRARKSAAKAAPAEAVAVAPVEAPPPPAMLAPPAVAELLRALPALAEGETLELQKAAEQLRRARLLSRSSSALKLFGRFPDWFDLQPHAHPKRVTLRPAG